MLGWVIKIAVAMNVDISEATQAIYIEELTRFPEHAVAAGCRKVIQEWDKPSLMPPIAVLIARILEVSREYQAQLEQHRTHEILSRASKPEDLVPIDMAAMEEYLRSQVQSKPADTDNWARSREARKIVLESKASGIWGKEIQEQAIQGLAKFNAAS